MTNGARLLSILTLSALVVACGSPAIGHGGAETPADESVATVTYDEHGEPVGLHRYRRWSERIGQGAQPKGAEAFQNIAGLGYRVVLSVDGARPDLENATAAGLRYVHIPIGYHGVASDEALRIVKAVESAEGPVYVHCHHGKHRGPTGAIIARIGVEGLGTDQALSDLAESGCSPKYSGLYRDVGAFRAPSADALAAVSADLPSFVPPPEMAGAMVAISFSFENLKESRDAEWATPPGNPDVDPPHEARMLWEHARETARLDESREYGERFLSLLTETETAAIALEASLRAGDKDGAETAYGRIKSACSSCHSDYRNTR